MNCADAHRDYTNNKIGKKLVEVIQSGDEQYANKPRLNKFIVSNSVQAYLLKITYTELLVCLIKVCGILRIWQERRFLAFCAIDFKNGQIVYVDGGILATIGKPLNEN